MKLQVQYVEPEFTAQAWPLIEKYIACALPYGNGDYTLEQVKLLVCMGQWLLLVAVDDSGKIHGVATVAFISYPNSRVAFITCMGGRLISSQDTYTQMSMLLKGRGATKIQGMARPSIARLWKRYGFNDVATLVESTI
jgi:hypothetical protein